MTTANQTHARIEPAILYFGTPVVLISTRNDDESANLAPMSSAFWLGWRAVLGLGSRSKTAQNLLRTGEGVLNLPSDSLASAVDRLALTTGSDPVPGRKRDRGYLFEPDKFGRAGLTPVPAETVSPPRVAECPVTLEVVVEAGLGPRVHSSTLARIPERLYRGPDIERSRSAATAPPPIR